MFRGTSFHNIDVKGRIKIPSRFRDMIKMNGGADDHDGLMVTGMDNGLVAYTFNEWRKIEERILLLAEKSDYMRRFRRSFIGGATECMCDKQDRILVPSMLRQYAQMEKEIVLVGVLDHFEIWSRNNWEKENTALEEDMKKEEFRNEVAKLGL